MDRRRFLRDAIVAAGGATLLPSMGMAMASAGTGSASVASGPYGELGTRAPDENGLVLPEGFRSKIVAVAGEPVASTGLDWHVYPDGAATFDDGDGGWWLVSNSEVALPRGGGGGASSVRFDGEGEIVDAVRVLDGTMGNCAGGPTPWGTWLSCEEVAFIGQAWECDPSGQAPAVARPAMGRFSHEAVAVDPERQQLYLTEDTSDGLLYRFTPTSYPDLSAGLLEAALVDADEQVTWAPVPEPGGSPVPTRYQVEGARTFDGGEGIWYHDGTVVFTSKGDNRVRAIDLAEQRISVVYRGQEPLSGVDNITVEDGSGDLYVAEDGGNVEIVLISAEGDVVPFVRVRSEGYGDSEVTGPVFNPAGDRLYFSSQRGPSPKTVREILGEGPATMTAGVTYEVTGPFRGTAGATTPSPSTTLATASAATNGTDAASDEGDGAGAAVAVGVGGVAVGAGAAAALWWRHRTHTDGESEAASASGSSMGE